MATLLEDLTGRRFGKLVVIGLSDFRGTAKLKMPHWKVRCDCGTEKLMKRGNLFYGGTKSCGCLTQYFQPTHRQTGTKEYFTWSRMKVRCEEGSKDFERYRKRGITVCHEWANSFEKFYEDMGAAPSRSHSIDRIDNDKGYFKENCRWATIKEQNRNKSISRILSINGESKCVAEWAEEKGFNLSTAWSRIMLGWPDEYIFSPTGKKLKTLIRERQIIQIIAS